MCLYLTAHLFLVGAFLVDAHCSRGRIAFLSCVPSFVREYSTLGGISANDSLMISPSRWSSWSVSVKVVGLIPCSSSIIRLNLSFP